MSLQVVTHVEGVREVFREVRKFEPKLVYKSQSRFRRAGQPIAEESRRLISSVASTQVSGGMAPMSGWAPGGRLGWSTGKVQSSVKISSGSKYDKARHQWSIIRVVQGSPAGMLMDWAGRSMRYVGARGRPARGHAFIGALPSFGWVKGSAHSRTLFPAIVATRRLVSEKFQIELRKTAREIEQRIGG